LALSFACFSSERLFPFLELAKELEDEEELPEVPVLEEPDEDPDDPVDFAVRLPDEPEVRVDGDVVDLRGADLGAEDRREVDVVELPERLIAILKS
jgi:hypothetical protein